MKHRLRPLVTASLLAAACEGKSPLSPESPRFSSGTYNPQPGGYNPQPGGVNPQPYTPVAPLPSGPLSKTAWYSSTQAARDAAIAATATAQAAAYGANTQDKSCTLTSTLLQCNCKVFARAMVYNASGGAITLPSTTPTAEGYKLDLSGGNAKLLSVVASRENATQAGSPRNLMRGNVVQLNFWDYDPKSGPMHTLIVGDPHVSSGQVDGFYAIEANYPKGTIRSNVRVVYYSDFTIPAKKTSSTRYVVIGNYTAYQVLSGK